MSEIQWVTLAQVAAAKLVVEMDLEDGREPNPLAVKIANATPLKRPNPADEPDEVEGPAD